MTKEKIDNVKNDIEDNVKNALAIINIEDTSFYVTYQGEIDEGKTYVGVMLTLIILVAAILGGIIIYNLGIISYTEKQYQFATLKVLGFKDSQIKNIFIKQNNWIAIVSIIIGLPLGYYLTDWLFKTDR